MEQPAGDVVEMRDVAPQGGGMRVDVGMSVEPLQAGSRVEASREKGSLSVGQLEDARPDEGLKGKWILCSMQTPVAKSPVQSPVPLLSADAQDIQMDGHRVVFSHGKSSVSLDLNGAVSDTLPVKCTCPAAGAPLRLEYQCDKGTVIDERRVVKNGTRLEQKLSLMPFSGDTPPLVERRYFRRRKSVVQHLLGLFEQQKVRLLFYLLASQVSLVLLVPFPLWGSFICASHTVALCLILFWTPKQDAALVAEEPDEVAPHALAFETPQLPKLIPDRQSISPLHHLKSERPNLAMVLERHKSENTTSSRFRTIRRSISIPARALLPSRCHSAPVKYMPDVIVKVSQVRKRQRGLSTYSEFELRVTTNAVKPDQAKSWTVWHRYASIHDFHKYLEKLLETDESAASRFTRIVPEIPGRTTSKVSSMTRSKRTYDDLLRRRMAGLAEFFTRIFGDESDPKVRHKALSDPYVQRFLKLTHNGP